jgi:folate-dependent phosphoribosylglycinamide formyltransferase PurN
MEMLVKKILFLGYDGSKTRLISFLRQKGLHVEHHDTPLGSYQEYADYDLLISFGYRHNIPKVFIDGFSGVIINLHISYLPYNRGAHPNFWAFYDNTPHGVSIHIIDEGVDTGPIICQRHVVFDTENTFKETHARLCFEVEDLFIANADSILAGRYTARPQRGKGSYHRVADLPEFPGGWDADIDSTLLWLDERWGVNISKKLAIIDQVEAIRSKNNVNWMDILRLAFTHAPDEAAKIMARINDDDGRISELLSELAK